jgi:hypothetical protein
MAAYGNGAYDRYCPEGDGGHRQIVNQDECEILQSQLAAVPVQNTPLGREDDSHVAIGYRDADIAGS